MSGKRKLAFFSLTRVTVLIIVIFGLVQPFTSSQTAHVLALAPSPTSSGNTNVTSTNGIGTSTSISTASANNSRFLTYQNLDFGIKMQYPSNWTKLEDNLLLHTIAAFSNIHQNPYDFTNLTLAEVDLRVYNAPQNETSAKLNIGQINTQGQVIISHYQNGTTTLGGLPALKIISYFFGDVSLKEMQVWTFVPSKNVLVELVYIAQPSKYSLYLPIVERMIDSVEIAH